MITINPTLSGLWLSLSDLNFKEIIMLEFSSALSNGKNQNGGLG